MLVKLLGSTDRNKRKGPCRSPTPSPGVILTFSEHFLCAKHSSSLQLQEVGTMISTSQMGKARHRQVGGCARGLTGGERRSEARTGPRVAGSGAQVVTICGADCQQPVRFPPRPADARSRDACAVSAVLADV